MRTEQQLLQDPESRSFNQGEGWQSLETHSANYFMRLEARLRISDGQELHSTMLI